MNQTPVAGHAPSAAPGTLTRRTVAKTAAWAAPAIALAAASPAYAASSKVAAIVLEKLTYEVPEGGSLTIKGTLVPEEGGSVPADIKLHTSVTGGTGFRVPPEIVVTGSTFEVTVDASAGATVSTLKVSSWNYLAYTAAEAELTLGPAPAPTGAIKFDSSLFQVANGVVEATGTLEPTAGTTLPADIQLVAVAEGFGYTLAEQAVVTGNTFVVKVAAAANASAGAISIQSLNYPSYTAARTQLSMFAPGYVDARYGMLPIANTWRATEGRDPAVRWFRPSTDVLAVTAAKLGVAKPWLDLRFMLNQASIFTDNFGNKEFGVATVTGGFPDGLPTLDVRTEAEVVSLAVGGVAQDPARGIGLRLGASILEGPGALTGSARPMVSTGFWPSHDAAGAAITANDKVFAFLPTTLPKGAAGTVEIVTTITRPDGAASKIGFVINYRYN